MEKDAKIYVAGAQTLIGAALSRQLTQAGYRNLVGGPGEGPELTDAAQVEAFFAYAAPDYVFLAGGRSGGIAANQKYPADLMRDNLLGTCHVLHSAYRHGVKKLLYLASSCSYPKRCPQPMQVESLLSGPLEPTSEAYAVAKLAGITLCQAYRRQYGMRVICGIPGDVFGPGDDFSREDAHVIPALISKIYEARVLGAESVEIWGTGTARREFIFADDLADACIFIMDRFEDSQPLNLGSGSTMTIEELAVAIKELLGYQGTFRFDTSRPDGMPVKVLDSARLRSMGWRWTTPFRVGLLTTVKWFLTVQREGGAHVYAAVGSGRP